LGIKIATPKNELVMGKNLKMSWVNSRGEVLNSKEFKKTMPIVNQNTITYLNVIPSIDNQYIVQEDKIKHNIILNEKPLIPEGTDFLFFGEEVELPANWRIEFDQNLTGLVVLNENNEVYLEIPAPQVYEENEVQIMADANFASFELTKLNAQTNKYQIITKVSAQWLNERTYPVIIDPTIVLNGNTSGYIWQDYERYYSPSECGYADITAVTYNAYNNVSARISLNRYYSYNIGDTYCYRYYHWGWGWSGHYHTYYQRQYYQDYYKGWIKYNTSSIPDNTTINGVEFSANISGGYTSNLYTYIYSSSSPGDYTTSTNSSQYNSISGGGTLGATNYANVGQAPYITLNTTANSRLQTLLPNDYFQIGLQSGNNTSGAAQIKTFDTNASLLRVTYEAACAEPVAICKTAIISLDATGNATLLTTDIDNGSTADCGLQTLTLSKTDFTCNDIGENTVTLTITDINGVSSSCDAIVTIEDNVLPQALAKDITVQFDEFGNASITATDIDNGSNDACGILSLEADNSFDCSNVGPNTVTLTVTDNNNNVSTTTAIVTVEDNVLPQALAKDITVQLDEFGNASITATDIDNGSNDACGILSLEADNSFDCSNVGPNTVTLTVTDNNNN
ncbi:hypothetical protein EC396_15240, partial [Lutibacter sp. HS1-25]